MQKTLLLIITSFIINSAKSQITKGNWLVGGAGHLSSQIETINEIKAKGFSYSISPNVGYFFVDKFAGGIKASVSYTKLTFNGGLSKSTQVGLGPFIRYYFLHAENRINILAESSYQYLHGKGNSGQSDNSNTFTFTAGPVIYFNSSVGLELTGNYELYNNKFSITNAKTFYVNIGFQIHLENNKEK